MKLKLLWDNEENPSRKQKEETGRGEAEKEAGILGIGRNTKERDCKRPHIWGAPRNLS